MTNIEDDHGVGDLPPILMGSEINGVTRRSIRRIVPVSDGRKRKLVAGKGGGVVKKGTSKRSKFFIVAEEQGGEHGKVKKAVGKQKLVKNKESGKKCMVVEEKDDEEYVHNEVGVKKRTRRSRTDGDGKDGDEGVAKNNGEKGVGCKVSDVDRVHVRVSLWSLHRLIPNLSPKQKLDVMDMGFGAVLGFRVKDVPTRLGYWLLDNLDEETCVLNVDGKSISITRETVRDVLAIPMGNVHVEARDEADFRHHLVVEWKQQFGKQERYKHIPVERKIYTQEEGGWLFKLNFLVLYFTSIGEYNKNATVNLRFLHCIQGENDIPGFDWCTYVLEFGQKKRGSGLPITAGR
ncbi:hypothetical protein CTI12_AA071390 [Artemisia annua]|uniref:Uncharacterized protein n=1 Tax=Artemisia annua TaxID=35608 RepID=A0A2U1Q5K9_ARTAN|nr:hypothetical protein CTI12_AA071390 [Artemisia annua]